MPSQFFFPNGFNGRVGIPGVPNSKLHLSVQIMGVVEAGGSDAAPLTTHEAPPTTDAAPASAGESQILTTETPVDGPQKLAVSILEAQGLQQMNHFTGDHPYVVCEICRKGVKVETKPVTEGDTMNPFWGETHTLDSYCPGDSLEFTVHDKGLLGAKTEGKVLVPAELILPHGFSGMLIISGLPQALLHVIIRPLGPSTKEETPVTTVKKSKRCC